MRTEDYWAITCITVDLSDRTTSMNTYNDLSTVGLNQALPLEKNTTYQEYEKTKMVIA